jgi:hypothetical protein
MSGAENSTFLEDPVLKAVFSLQTLFAEPPSSSPSRSGSASCHRSPPCALPVELAERPAHSLTDLLQQLEAATSLYSHTPPLTPERDDRDEQHPTTSRRTHTQSSKRSHQLASSSSRPSRSSSSLSQCATTNTTPLISGETMAPFAASSSSAPSLRALLLSEEGEEAAHADAAGTGGAGRGDGVYAHSERPGAGGGASAELEAEAAERRQNHARLRFLYSRCVYLVQLVCQALLRHELTLQAGVRHWRVRTERGTESRPASEIEEALEEMALCGSRLGVRKRTLSRWYLLEKTPLYWCRRLLLSSERRPVHPLTEASRNLVYLRALSPRLLRPAGRCRLFLHHASISLHHAAEAIQAEARAQHIATSLRMAQGCLRGLYTSLSQLLRRLRDGRDACVISDTHATDDELGQASMLRDSLTARQEALRDVHHLHTTCSAHALYGSRSPLSPAPATTAAAAMSTVSTLSAASTGCSAPTACLPVGAACGSAAAESAEREESAAAAAAARSMLAAGDDDDLDSGENAYELLLEVTGLAVSVDRALQTTLRSCPHCVCWARWCSPARCCGRDGRRSPACSRTCALPLSTSPPTCTNAS